MLSRVGCACESAASTSTRCHRSPWQQPTRHPPSTTSRHRAAVRLFVARAQAVRADFALTARERRDGGRDLPTAGRAAAGDRAGGRAGQGASADGAAGTARAPHADADRREPRPAAAPAHDARRHRLELRPAGDRGAGAVSPPRGLCRRLHAGGGRRRGQCDRRCGARPLRRDHRIGRGQPAASGARRRRRRSPATSMLETIREYGLEQLAASGEEAKIRDAHAAWCLGLAEQAAPFWYTGEQGRWAARLEADHDNLRAALAWLAQTGDTATGRATGRVASVVLVLSQPLGRRARLAGASAGLERRKPHHRAHPGVEHGGVFFAVSRRRGAGDGLGRGKPRHRGRDRGRGRRRHPIAGAWGRGGLERRL